MGLYFLFRLRNKYFFFRRLSLTNLRQGFGTIASQRARFRGSSRVGRRKVFGPRGSNLGSRRRRAFRFVFCEFQLRDLTSTRTDSQARLLITRAWRCNSAFFYTQCGTLGVLLRHSVSLKGLDHDKCCRSSQDQYWRFIEPTIKNMRVCIGACFKLAQQHAASMVIAKC